MIKKKKPHDNDNSKPVINKTPKTDSQRPKGQQKQVRQATTKSYQYEMNGHANSCVERYLELSQVKLASLKSVPTPCIDDHQLQSEDFSSPGKLSPVAARIVLKALYLARIGRPD